MPFNSNPPNADFGALIALRMLAQKRPLNTIINGWRCWSMLSNAVRKMLLNVIVVFIVMACSTTATKGENQSGRQWRTSFENVSDFDGFYITEQNHLNSTFHIQDSTNPRTGNYAHKAWIQGKNKPSTIFVNNNHRGYPTIQLYKTKEGGFSSPFYFELYVWVDAEMRERRHEDDWISLATFSDSKTDRWERTVLVNLSWDGFVHLAHVPNQGKLEHEFQTQSTRLPQKQWVKISGYFEFGKNGYAKVWQNDELVSAAKIENTISELNQAHFGLYAPPHMKKGVVYNDDLIIKEVSSIDDIDF